MSQRLRILHIIKSLGRGGAETLLPETLKYHDRKLFDFYYAYFLPWKNQMVEPISSLGATVTCFSASNNFFLMLRIFQVARYVRENNIQLIHAHLPWGGIIAKIVGKICHVPVVYSEHNKQERYHPVTRFLNLTTMPLASIVVAVSDDVGSSLKRHRPSLKTPIKAIANGVDVESYSRRLMDASSVRKNLGIDMETVVIGTVAVFRTQKRLDVWLDIARKVLDRNPDVRFVIVGDGPLRLDLEAKMKTLDLQGKIFFTGLQTDVRPFLGIMDIYMITSIFEGLPLALLEAMAMECAVISTDAGGIKEVVIDGESGRLCDTSSPFDLIDFAEQLIEDRHRRELLGANARTRVKEAFGLRRMTHDLEKVYTELINSK